LGGEFSILVIDNERTSLRRKGKMVGTIEEERGLG
jgi:hypothetical protein